MVATAIIGGVTAIGGAVIQGSAAKSAAKTQANAAAQSNALLQQQYDQTRKDLSPYNTIGQGQFTKYNALTTGDPGAAASTLATLPGYQFTLQQGLKSTQNAAAARGLGVSGAALKGASTYATGLANSNYASYANQLLAGSQLGEQAAAGTATANNAIAGAQAGNITGAGNAEAAGTIGAGNAAASGINGVANGLNSLFLFNALNKGQGGGLYNSSGGGYVSSPSGYNNLLGGYGTG